MRRMSIYEVDCLCGAKAKVQFGGKATTCPKCGREIAVESWQVQQMRYAAARRVAKPPEGR